MERLLLKSYKPLKGSDANQIAAILITLSDFRVICLLQIISNVTFWTPVCPAIDKTATETAHHVIPLPQMSFLSTQELSSTWHQSAAGLSVTAFCEFHCILAGLDGFRFSNTELCEFQYLAIVCVRVWIKVSSYEKYGFRF